MNSYIFTFLAIFMGITVFGQSGVIRLTGQVKNPSGGSVMISHIDNQKLVSAALDTNGNFSLKTKAEEGYYFLNYGRNSTYIFLFPNDAVKVTFDANDFENSLVFEGIGAARNNYLQTKSKIHKELTDDLVAFYKVNEATYLKNIARVKDQSLSALANFNVEKYFKKAEEKSVEYERLLSIQNYKSNYKFYLGEEVTPTENFYRPTRSIKYKKEEYIKQPYYRYLMNSIWSNKIDAAPNVEEMLQILKKVPSNELAISLVTGFYSKISVKNARSKDYLALIKQVTKHKPFIEAAEKRYAGVVNASSIGKGDNSPEFSYEAVDGAVINSKDLKGKYVYIDVWATWCAPCIKQVPYLKQLEERYQGKAIVFVSISVDKLEVKDTWKQMVKDKNLGGLQLFADKSFDSNFMKKLAVNSIPRFILIDPKGKIIDADASRPSFAKTKELLDSLVF